MWPCPPKCGFPVNTFGVFKDVLQRREVVATYLTSAAAGQVDMRPFLDLHSPALARTAAAKFALGGLADEVYDIVLELGGTISSRNGTGSRRSPWVSRQYGRLYPVFRELKAVFDPRRLFNPGKIVGPVPGALQTYGRYEEVRGAMNKFGQ